MSPNAMTSGFHFPGWSLRRFDRPCVTLLRNLACTPLLKWTQRPLIPELLLPCLSFNREGNCHDTHERSRRCCIGDGEGRHHPCLRDSGGGDQPVVRSD